MKKKLRRPPKGVRNAEEQALRIGVRHLEAKGRSPAEIAEELGQVEGRIEETIRVLRAQSIYVNLTQKKLLKYRDSILAHCHYPIATSKVEGMNNKVKLIKRIAFGFRDFDYFALKIRGTFQPTHTSA